MKTLKLLERPRRRQRRRLPGRESRPSRPRRRPSRHGIEEAARYKGVAVELDKEKRLVESDLTTARGAYGRIKEALLKSEIARGATEEAEKNAHEDLEAERTRSHGLSDDIDHLKKMLR
jgi:hypothetical protein